MRYIIIGASASAISAVKEIRKNDKECIITMISEDDNIYSRCILHHYLSDKRTVEQLSFIEPNFEEIYNVEWIKGKRVVDIDTDKKIVCTSDNIELEYDKVLVASGARSTLPNIDGIVGVGNVIGFRNFDDVEVIKLKSKTSKNIVVLGAGLVGMDATVGLVEHGVSGLTLIEATDRLLNKQLDKYSSSKYEEKLKSKGVELIFNTMVKSVNSDDDNNVKSIVLSNGEIIPCDLLIVTIGVKSNCEFLENTKVNIDKFGIVVDEFGRTNVEGVYAAGDVTGRGPIWPVAVKEGIIAANNMTGGTLKMTDFFYNKSTMSFFDINTMSIGLIEPTDSVVEEVYNNDGVYKRILHKDNVIIGAILQGDLSYGGVLTRLISNKIDISKVNKPIFKIDYSDFFNIDSNAEFYYSEQ